MREKKKGEGDNLVIIATKSEMTDVRNNPNQIFVVLVYKDTLLSANDLTYIPSVVAHVLQEYNDVFLRKHQLDYLHCKKLSIKLISCMELHFLTIPHTEPTLKKPKKFKGKYKHF
jgi:hypothetical protein